MEESKQSFNGEGEQNLIQIFPVFSVTMIENL